MGSPGSDGSFNISLRSALQADSADPNALRYNKTAKGAADTEFEGTAKDGPKRGRKADALADGGGSGQPCILTPLAPVQEEVLSWQTLAGVTLKLQTPAASNSVQVAATSTIQNRISMDEAGLPPPEMVAPLVQQSEQDVTSRTADPGTTPAADACGLADTEAITLKPTDTLTTANTASLGQVSQKAGSRGESQAHVKNAPEAQPAVFPQQPEGSKSPKDPVALTNESLLGLRQMLSPDVAPIPSPQPSAALTSATVMTKALNPAIRTVQGVTDRSSARLTQASSEQEPSFLATAPTQGVDTDLSLISLSVCSQQDDVGASKAGATFDTSSVKARDGKAYATTSLLDALSPVPGDFGIPNQASGPPQILTPNGSAHQTPTVGPVQAGELQTQTLAATNLQRALQRSEMQVHVDAAEYGRVSVHASYGREGLAARIRVEDTVLASALGSALSAGAPNLEQRLRGDMGTRAVVSVSTDTGSARSNGDAGQGESRSRDQARVLPTPRSSSTSYVSTTTLIPTIVRGISDGTRLDVHI